MESKLRSLFRRVLGAFDIPHVPKTPPKPKSPLRVQFETEWAEAVNSAGRTLCLAGLGTISGVMLALTAMLCFGEKRHAALARHMANAENERKNRDRIDRMNAFFGNEYKRPLPNGWEKTKLGDEVL